MRETRHDKPPRRLQYRVPPLPTHKSDQNRVLPVLAFLRVGDNLPRVPSELIVVHSHRTPLLLFAHAVIFLLETPRIRRVVSALVD